MKHLPKWFAPLLLLAGLYGPVQVIAQTPDTPTAVIVQDVPTYEAETVTVQAVWLDNLIADRNNLAIYIALILGAVMIAVAGVDYLQARSRAKTDDERSKATETFTNRLIAALEDANTRNAAERKMMTEEMLPVRTFLELVEAVTRIAGDVTQNAVLKAISEFTEDVTETTPGENLDVKFGTSGGEPESPQQALG